MDRLRRLVGLQPNELQKGEEKEPDKRLRMALSQLRFSPESGRTTLEHHQQLYNWDCGLVCCRMILQWLGKTSDIITKHSTVGTTSIWTMDLLVLLQQFDVAFVWCSTCIGINPDWQRLDYYKTHFTDDCVRIQKQIEPQLQQHRCVQTDLALQRIVEWVQVSNCVVMALVDHSVLLGHDEGVFTGHYIVLVGVEEEPPSFVVHNPTKNCRDTITMALFERAWRADGTDQDVVVIVKPEVS